MAIYDTSLAIEYARGDSVPITFAIKENGVAVDVTGYSFTLTVNTDRSPVDVTNQQFALAGVLTDPTNGGIEFRPTTINTDLTPGVYYYDLQQTDSGGYVRTLVKSTFSIVQDINKG